MSRVESVPLSPKSEKKIALPRTYTLRPDGIYKPDSPVRHRDEEYDQAGFDVLLKMQERHFWYRGRNRFLLNAVVRRLAGLSEPLRAVDLGGGVGGWVSYLANELPGTFSTLALADSSLTALNKAVAVLPPGTERYQVDLMDLGWERVWDVAFLLDVLEHLSDDSWAVRQASIALKPGGFLFVSSPALPFFWSYNDEFAHHVRRYTRKDFTKLALNCDLALVEARYFMFLLSPLYWLSRKTMSIKKLSQDRKGKWAIKAHKISGYWVNETLAAIFALESPVGHFLRFPWGTSILGVFQKL